MDDTSSTARARLTAERRDALERLKAARSTVDRLRAERAADPSADDEHDPDGSTLSGEWTMAEAQRRLAESTLDGIERALARLGTGSYGVCTSCGRPVEPVRLAARPAAPTCLACASAQQ